MKKYSFKNIKIQKMYLQLYNHYLQIRSMKYLITKHINKINKDYNKLIH